MKKRNTKGPRFDFIVPDLDEFKINLQLRGRQPITIPMDDSLTGYLTIELEDVVEDSGDFENQKLLNEILRKLNRQENGYELIYEPIPANDGFDPVLHFTIRPIRALEIIKVIPYGHTKGKISGSQLVIVENDMVESAFRSDTGSEFLEAMTNTHHFQVSMVVPLQRLKEFIKEPENSEERCEVGFIVKLDTHLPIQEVIWDIYGVLYDYTVNHNHYLPHNFEVIKTEAGEFFMYFSHLQS